MNRINYAQRPYNYDFEQLSVPKKTKGRSKPIHSDLNGKREHIQDKKKATFREFAFLTRDEVLIIRNSDVSYALMPISVKLTKANRLPE